MAAQGKPSRDMCASRADGSLEVHAKHCGSQARRSRSRVVSFSSWFLLCMLLQTLVNPANAQDPGETAPETEDPALSGAVRPSCSIFVDASLKRNRFLLIQGYDDDADVVVLDQFPSVVPGLGDLPPAEAYRQLRPGFMSIADHLHAQPKPLLVQPRHCHTHLLVASELERHLGSAKLDVMLKEILQASIEDAQFPFMFARDDLRVIDSRAKGYYQMLGVNFLDGRIAQTLAPGAVELSGVLSLHDDSLLLAFDQQERWRRGIRRKQLSRSLNTTDFFIFEHLDFVQDRLHLVMARHLYKLEQERPQEGKGDEKITPTSVTHPCLPHGTKETLPVVGAAESGVRFEGTGDAKGCVASFTELINLTNKDCPPGSYCLLNSVSQPRPVSPFFASGKFMTVTRFANEVLDRLKKQEGQKNGDQAITLLELPLPTLAQVRTAADQLCATPASLLGDWDLSYDGSKSVTDACFDLCEVIVLLQQLGVEENERRVVFGEPLAPSVKPASEVDLANRKITTGSSASEVSWVVGVFLVLQLLEKRQTFSIESDYFAEQVGEGVPLGLNMSILIFMAAAVFLYLTTGARVSKTKPGGYHAASTGSNVSINSNRPPPARHSTSAIVFVDDASE